MLAVLSVCADARLRQRNKGSFQSGHAEIDMTRLMRALVTSASSGLRNIDRPELT